MALPEVQLGDPHVAAHNDEREIINELLLALGRTSSDPITSLDELYTTGIYNFNNFGVSLPQGGPVPFVTKYPILMCTLVVATELRGENVLPMQTITCWGTTDFQSFHSAVFTRVGGEGWTAWAEVGGAPKTTGWRYLEAGYVAAVPAFGMYIRRTGDDVEVIPFMTSNPVVDVYEIVGAVPDGFIPDLEFEDGAYCVSFTTLFTNKNGDSVPDQLQIGKYEGIQSYIGSMNFAMGPIGGGNYPRFSYKTSDPWPTTLPGDARP